MGKYDKSNALIEKIGVTDFFLYNQYEDMVVRHDAKADRWFARFSQDVEIIIESSTDIVQHALGDADQITQADYYAY